MRQVERSFGRYERGPGLAELDLSAFEAEPDRAERYEPGNYQNPAFLARPQGYRKPGAAGSMQTRKREAEQATSRAALLRVAQSKAKLAAQAKAVGQTQVKSAKAAHLQAEPSTQSRKERMRETCKERPDARKKGGGKSRAFVPWCSRRS